MSRIGSAIIAPGLPGAIQPGTPFTHEPRFTRCVLYVNQWPKYEDRGSPNQSVAQAITRRPSVEIRPSRRHGRMRKNQTQVAAATTPAACHTTKVVVIQPGA